MITDYLLALDAALDVPGRRRRRILAEVEDHLLSAAAELHAQGLPAVEAERLAVAHFGDPAALTHQFVRDERARRGARVGLLSVPLALVAGWLGIRGSVVMGVPFPVGAIAFVLAQVGLVAGGLSGARALLLRRRTGPTAELTVLVERGFIAVAGCAALSVASTAAAVLGRGATPPAIAWAAGGLVVALGATGVHTLRGVGRAGAKAELPPDHDILAEVELVAGRRSSVRLERWLGLRRRPWCFAVAVAAAAGLALAAAHAVAEGAPTGGHLGGWLLAGITIAGVEVTAALAGFAVLGRWLGIRGRDRDLELLEA